jgi:hypothetical protein
MVFKVALSKKIEVTHNGKTATISLFERGKEGLVKIYEQLETAFAIPSDVTITGFILDDGGAICHFDLFQGLRGTTHYVTTF